MRHIEILSGVAAGVLIFLFWQGINILPVLLFLALAGLSLYASTGRMGRKSFASVNGSDLPSVQFTDIGGQEVAKKELCEALEFIRDTDKLKALGIRPLKGILLTGPPGTGKTLLAKAAANYTNAVFVAASGSEFVEMYVGVGAQRIRQLFTQARSTAQKAGKKNAVIFIDEIEVLGGKRGQGSNNMEHDQTLNELLVQMDGLTSEQDVRLLLIGATNRPDMLDTALLRPGRFDRSVKVDLPDKTGRLAILELHTKNKPLSQDVSLTELAADTFGMSGAHLENVANEAAILALREESPEITPAHLRSAIEKVMMGEKLDRLPQPEEKYRIAVHEAGHAIVSETVQPGSVASVNVASRSNALGYVRQTQPDDVYLYTAQILKDKIAVALAGSVAEQTLLESRSTGASNDFKQAAAMAKQLIYGGMSPLGIISPDDVPQDLLHRTIAELLKEIETYTFTILAEKKNILESVTKILLEQECLSGSELRTLLQKVA